MARRPAKNTTIPNEQAFDRYRRFVEGDVQHGARVDRSMSGFGLALQCFAAWGGRYRRRRNILEGGLDYSDTLADQIARGLLLERNQRIDREFPKLPDWDTLTRSMIEGSVRNTKQLALDVPHPHGPSVRRLWSEAQQHGISGDRAWMYILDWALRLPTAFAIETERLSRKEQPLANQHHYLEQPAEWTDTGDANVPWKSVEPAGWQVGLNDFPDEFMYTLHIDGKKIGDFHDWPKSWSRPGQPAESIAAPRRRTAAAAPAVPTHSPETWLDRYRAGECASVWSEMNSLGPDIRSRKYFGPAQAVAQETMSRTRGNIELLMDRLNRLGYRFWQRPAAPDLGEWSKLQAAGLVLPLSIAAWIEQVGSVDLNGNHPELSPMEGAPGFNGMYSDPLMIVPDLGWTQEQWSDAQAAGESHIELILSWDDLGKAGLYLDSQVETQYTIRVPNTSADSRLEHEWHNTQFVNYLRTAFRWGGFPGWERYPNRPEKILSHLGSDLTPI
jgi:hypothetical protein